MVCLACAARFDWPLCDECRHGLAAGPEFLLGGRLLVSSAFRHRTVARRLVHRLKYGGLIAAGAVLADSMVGRLPADAAALVPVPRAVTRRVRFGVDPAAVLADLLATRTGLPVVPALRPALWWARHASRAPGDRRPARFVASRPAPSGAVLIDDVVTSGATVLAAARVLPHARYAVAATSPGSVAVSMPGHGSGGASHDRRDNDP